MVTISRVYKGRRIRSSGATRADALANIERLIWWLDRFSFLKHVAAAASIVVKPVLRCCIFAARWAFSRGCRQPFGLRRPDLVRSL